MARSDWRDVRVSHLSHNFNSYGQAQLGSCHWCTGDALYFVERTSNITDHYYGNRACYRHAVSWDANLTEGEK